jgi:hypothetical protein
MTGEDGLHQRIAGLRTGGHRPDLLVDALGRHARTGGRLHHRRIRYDYQSLAALRNFDLTGEPVAFVKVVELGYAAGNGRSLLVKIWTKDVDDIYAAARSLIGPAFDFRDHHLNYAKLSIKLKKVGKDRARTITVILRDDNKLLRKQPEMYLRDLPDNIRIPALDGNRPDEVVRRLEDATIDDLAFAIKGMESESRLIHRRLSGLRDLYEMARKRGALGVTTVTDAFANISAEEADK